MRRKFDERELKRFREHQQRFPCGHFNPPTPLNMQLPVDWNVIDLLRRQRGLTWLQLSRAAGAAAQELAPTDEISTRLRAKRCNWAIGRFHQLEKRDTVRAAVLNLVSTAQALGVDPETLVNKELFFKRKRLFAGYRLAVRATQRRIPFHDLLFSRQRQALLEADITSGFYWRVVALSWGLMSGFDMPGMSIGLVQYAAERVELDPSDLFTPLKIARDCGIVAPVYDCLSSLSGEDKVLVYGFARLLQSGLRGEALLQELRAVLEATTADGNRTKL